MKTKNNDLVLESWKSSPKLLAAFLDTGTIFAEFRNNSQNTIKIHEISCQFTSEDGLKPSKFTNDKLIYLEPKNARVVTIDVKFGLELKKGTNIYLIFVKFKFDRSSKMKEQTFERHDQNLIITTKRDSDDEFFISHKDPQDTSIAKKLKFYLEKSGFKGFVAEEDTRPGIELWGAKILPSINQCKALIVIWTINSQKDSKAIKREIQYAKKKGKIIILIIEGNLTVPKFISSKKEYSRFPKITDESLIEIVVNINRRYESGDYEE